MRKLSRYVLGTFATLITLSLSLIYVSATYAMLVDLKPYQDTYVTDNHSDYNIALGSGHALLAGHNSLRVPVENYYTFLQFSFGQVPAGSTVSQATLKMYLADTVDTVTYNTLSLYIGKIMGSWDEDVVTWVSKPEITVYSGKYTLPITEGYVSFDIKDLVSKWVNGSVPNYGLAIYQTQSVPGLGYFYSRDSGDYEPVLSVTYTEPSTTLTTTPTPTPTPVSSSRTVTRSTLITDTTAPVISNVKTATVGISSVRVTWTTDENSSSYVEYGDTSGYGNRVGQNDSVTSHSVTLSGLTPLKIYHFRVLSSDSFGNQAVSRDSRLSVASIDKIYIPGITARDSSTDSSSLSSSVPSSVGTDENTDTSSNSDLPLDNNTDPYYDTNTDLANSDDTYIPNPVDSDSNQPAYDSSSEGGRERMINTSSTNATGFNIDSVSKILLMVGGVLVILVLLKFLLKH